MSLIKIAQKDAENHLVLARNSRQDMHSWIRSQTQAEFPDLDPRLLSAAITFASSDCLATAAKECGTNPQSLKKALSTPLASAAVSFYRAIYTDAKITDAAWVNAQRVRIFHSAMGDVDIHKVDKDGMGQEIKETQLSVARQVLNDIEKADNLIDLPTQQPIINVIANGDVSISQHADKKSSDAFLQQFQSTSVDVDTDAIEGEVIHD